ncbi:hypothetical protein SAMN04489860_1217 [Paraoerskovia marina]|uniref:Uncharacterized protein n=1 Tax=Paraoerskovia marina TaxID=545619 RepID=A0A1H1QZL0_9CELL|nr:hypothetical protein [Paraoerskovia marina]SDS28820.1 hypothetical protein SAMN04489860_1217 [Paraoerskovia marina]
MRWDRLVDDLEAQFDAEARAGLAGQTAELTRAEQAAVVLADRLRATRDPVSVVLGDGSVVTGRVAHVGADWVVVRPEPGRDSGDELVPISAIDVVEGVGVRTRADERMPRLTSVLRALQRDRVLLTIRTRAASTTGRLARVGRDHLDVVEERDRFTGRPRTRVVRIDALLVLRESDPHPF